MNTNDRFLRDLSGLHNVAQAKRNDVDALIGDNRTGCALAIWLDNGPVIRRAPDIVILVGHVDDEEKWEKYFRLAIEKGWRLGEHPEHLTSSQSANEAEQKYGGAIRIVTDEGDRYRVSVSGLSTGIADETAAMLISEAIVAVPPQHLEDLAAASNNDLWAKAA